MIYILMFLAAFVGLWLADAGREMLGLVGGAVMAYLFIRVSDLQKRLQALESRSQHRAEREVAGLEEPSRAADLPSVNQSEGRTTSAEPLDESQPTTVARNETTGLGASSQPSEFPEVLDPVFPESVEAPPKPPSSVQRGLDLAKNWLTTGNVPVKLGLVVSFFGVAFLLRYAVDKQVLVVPIEVRYLLITMTAIALLAVGWKLRRRSTVYALSLQGGGIGILYLTIFAAFRLHPLLPPLLAFGLLIALTAFTGVLAVLQNAQALAVLGVVGGFAAPVLVSTGSGNHVALFSYYLLLTSAVLGIAWFKSWRLLNVLSFLFTFGVGAAWGARSYRPELFASTEPFLIIFFVLFQVIAILFAFRQPPKLRGLVDGTLIFGTPVVAFGLQSQLLADNQIGLALSAVALAIFYLLTATFLHRSQGSGMRLLTEAFVALGVAFATLAVPLALDGGWTAATWALEGAALVWVGVRQNNMLAKLSGSGLIGAAGLIFVDDGWNWHSGLAFLNSRFLGGLMIASAALFAARYLAADERPSRWQGFASVGLLLWGLLWWFGTGTTQIYTQFSDGVAVHVHTLFTAASVIALAWLARRYDWLAARRATLAFVPLLPLLALAYVLVHGHLFAGFGALAWLAVIAAHFGLLWAYDNGQGRLEGLWHLAGGLLISGLIAFEIAWQVQDAGLADTWVISAGMLVVLIVAAFVLVQKPRMQWPLQRYGSAYIALTGLLLAGHLLTMFSVGLNEPGDTNPLPYIPILNPFDLMTVAGLLLAVKWLLGLPREFPWFNDRAQRIAFSALGFVAFVLSTISVVRATHHLSDIAWRQHALLESVQVQSALSIYWAALGFGAMLLGTRWTRRWLWLAGAGLMVIVVLKLFFVDFGNTGTVARIVSFIGVGGLLVVVGYFAPAPPRQLSATSHDTGQ